MCWLISAANWRGCRLERVDDVESLATTVVGGFMDIRLVYGLRFTAQRWRLWGI